MFKRILALIFFLVVTTPALAEIFYFVPHGYPNPEIVVLVDTENREAAIAIGAASERLEFPDVSEPGREFEVSMVGPELNYTYVYFYYEDAPDHYRRFGAIISPDGVPLPHRVYSELELRYPVMTNPYLTTNLWYFYRSPSPDIYTTEELGATAGEVEVEAGTLKFPMGSMLPGEEVRVYDNSEEFTVDGHPEVAPGIRVDTPAGVDSFTVDLLAAGPGTTIAVKGFEDSALGLTGETMPWRFLDAPAGAPTTVTPSKPDQTVGQTVLKFIAGEKCYYVSGAVQVRRLIRTGTCEPQPQFVTEIIGAVHAARNAMSEIEDFTLEPMQYVWLVSGIPFDGSSSYGQVSLNDSFVTSITLENLQSAAVHETCHALMYPLLGRDRRNWITESAAVHCEFKTGLSDYYLTRYDFQPDVVKRGLDNSLRATTPPEFYTGAFFYNHLDRAHSTFKLGKFIREQKVHILNDDGITAFTEGLNTIFEGVIGYFANAAKQYHQNLLQISFNQPEPPTVNLEAGVEVEAGTSVIWDVPVQLDRACVIVSGTNDVEIGTWLLNSELDENFSRLNVAADVDGKYRLYSNLPAYWNIPAGRYIFTLTSVVGTGWLLDGPTVNIRITTDLHEWQNECQA